MSAETEKSNEEQAGDKAGEAAKPGVASLAQNLEEMQAKLAAFEKFVARRFDELSMEVNATSQQFDMVEDNIGQKFADVFETLGAISYKGDGSTAANTGVELDAVVDMAEEAATKILDAAGRIGGWVGQREGWDKDDTRAQYLDMISNCVEEIFLACSFQDITGQRIRKTLENISTIEKRLDEALERLGVHVDKNSGEPKQWTASQDDVDKLFAVHNAGSSASG